MHAAVSLVVIFVLALATGASLYDAARTRSTMNEFYRNERREEQFGRTAYSRQITIQSISADRSKIIFTRYATLLGTTTSYLANIADAAIYAHPPVIENDVIVRYEHTLGTTDDLKPGMDAVAKLIYMPNGDLHATELHIVVDAPLVGVPIH